MRSSSGSQSIGRPASSTSFRGLDGIRLDRLGRVALLLGVLLIGVFYISSGVKLVVAHFERVDQASQVRALQAENARLVAERRQLRGRRGIATQARKLGMVMPGEVPYVVTGLPGDHR